jgi:hypothetical protein
LLLFTREGGGGDRGGGGGGGGAIGGGGGAWMLKADDDDDDDSTFPSLFCEVVVVEPPPRSSFSFSSTSFLLPPPPGTNAGAFAFMVLYLCVSLLRSDWNEVTGLPLLEKVKKKMKKKSRESWQNGSCQLCGLSQFQELYGVSVVSDVLLKDRDVVLAENVLKGVDIAKRLRKKELLSKQFTFYSSPSSDDAFLDEEKDTAIEESQLPVFTLKRPFESRDEIRRLNLFEPRWLRMLDEIAKRNEGSLVGAKLGVVLAQNRLYTPENFNDEDDDNKNIDNQTEKKRVARIVFDPFVQRAKVVDAKESTRPVTGARKVEVVVGNLLLKNLTGDGRARSGSLKKIKRKKNDALARILLIRFARGPRSWKSPSFIRGRVKTSLLLFSRARTARNLVLWSLLLVIF